LNGTALSFGIDLTGGGDCGSSGLGFGIASRSGSLAGGGSLNGTGFVGGRGFWAGAKVVGGAKSPGDLITCVAGGGWFSLCANVAGFAGGGGSRSVPL
jgi:hypothetical protein